MDGLVLQSVSFLEGLEDNEAATPQSFFRVKEGSGVGKRVANKLADIGIVEEQVPFSSSLSECL